jgi:hypothetical protein
MRSARAHLVEVTRVATDHALTARHAATMTRVAQERLARLAHALAELPDVAAIKKKSGAKDATPRVSTTDPDARVMKMPDGGFRPAFNVQFSTTTDATRAIVGVSVTNRGSDQGQATPCSNRSRPAPACAPPSCSSMVATPITTPSIRPPPRA